MRKLLVATSVIGIAVVGTGLAGAAGSRIVEEETFSITENTTFVVFDTKAADLGDMDPGDEVIYRSQLLDPTDGTKVGLDRVNCTINKPPMMICTAALALTGRGTISAQFAADVTSPEGFLMAITGGTGEFENVRGSITADTSDQVATLTFHLLP